MHREPISELDAILDRIRVSGSCVVVVVGPQRSGTQIGSKILASELGARYFHSEDFGIGSIDRFLALASQSLSSGLETVIHAPAVMHAVELLPERVSVVCMRRDINDIVESQERINWTRLQNEERYKFNSILYRERYDPDLKVSQVKYAVWDDIMKPRIPYSYDLPYEALSTHPKFLDKESRKGFRAHQTES